MCLDTLTGHWIQGTRRVAVRATHVSEWTKRPADAGLSFWNLPASLIALPVGKRLPVPAFEELSTGPYFRSVSLTESSASGVVKRQEYTPAATVCPASFRPFQTTS